MAGALENPFLERTGMIRNTPHPQRNDFRTLANPIKLDGQRLASKVCSALGADTDELLREIGLTEQELHELHAAGVA
jgi:crotonobetainyl-CoA:carnitine CoA-transferase CaiB-like acyl-CoA transferase